MFSMLFKIASYWMLLTNINGSSGFTHISSLVLNFLRCGGAKSLCILKKLFSLMILFSDTDRECLVFGEFSLLI